MHVAAHGTLAFAQGHNLAEGDDATETETENRVYVSCAKVGRMYRDCARCVAINITRGCIRRTKARGAVCIYLRIVI